MASISLVKNNISSLEKILQKLFLLKQSNEKAIGDDELKNSKNIESEISRGISIQNSSNTLMQNITGLVKTLKKEVILHLKFLFFIVTNYNFY